MKLPGSTCCQQRAPVPLVQGRAVPNHQQCLRYVRPHVLENDHAVEAIPRFVAPQRVQTAVPGDPAHHRQMLTGIHRPQDGCLSAWRVCADGPWQAREPRCVHQHAGAACYTRLFWSSGHTSTRHGLITASARWAAHAIGSWGVHGQAFKSRETCALWYATPHSSQMTGATRAQVQHSPRNPYDAAPGDHSSGILGRWSGASLTGPVGRGLARHASLPWTRAAATHWLTAAAETPTASAVSHGFHPCSLSASARLRRPSCPVLGHRCWRSMCGV
jgi:hypothetical protein